MREILFRGKTSNGEWVEGFYLYTNENTQPVIIDMECCSNVIIPETIGQYTGLKDKNGVRIFEGDIVITKTTSCKFVGCILYSTEYVRFVCVTKSKMSYPMDSKFEYEVIGNIHDNPEL